MQHDERGMINALTAYRVRITENYFHHNQRQEGGYGVGVQSWSYAWIDKNTFDWNRHAIMGGRRELRRAGLRPRAGYLAYLNLVLPGHSEQDGLGGLVGWQTHHFDVHGTESDGLGRDGYDGWAGEFFDVADNSFLGILGTAFDIRGTPSESAQFHHNVLPPNIPATLNTGGGVSYYRAPGSRSATSTATAATTCSSRPAAPGTSPTAGSPSGAS